MKQYIIWGNYPETAILLAKIREKDDGVITVIDQNMKAGVSIKGDVVYTAADYTEITKFYRFPQIHYKYIPPEERTDNETWCVEEKRKSIFELFNR